MILFHCIINVNGENVQRFNLTKITTYQAGAIQASMHRSLQQRCDELLKPFGITKMQWLIIGNTLDAGKNGIRVSDLAVKLSTTIPYLTTALNLLESRGIVARLANSQDARSRLIKVKPDFAKKCKHIETALRQGLRGSIYSEIKPEDFEVYMKVMYRLNEAHKNEREQ